MAVAVKDDFVDDDAVKSLFGGDGEQFFGQGDVFLGGKTEGVDEVPDLVLSFLDALADLHFLLAGEQGDSAHLAQVHPDGVIQDVQVGLLKFFLFFRGFAVDLGGVDDFDVHAAEFDEQLVEVLGGGDFCGQGGMEVIVGEMSLFMGEPEEFAEFLVKVEMWCGLFSLVTGCGRRGAIAWRGHR